MVFSPTSATINFTPLGYMARPSGGTGRETGKISPSVGTADLANIAPTVPRAEAFKNSRRESGICLYQATILTKPPWRLQIAYPIPPGRLGAARAWLHDVAATCLPPASEYRTTCSRSHAIHLASSGAA